MNLRTVDLNLLVVLDALLTEAHVSRAAKQLNVSQPAVSAALERCRHLFKDPLLERAQGGMRLTPRAESLRAPVRAILKMVSETLSPEPPDIRQMRRTVRIIMPDVPAIPLAKDLLAKLHETVPLVDLVVLPWNSAPFAADALAKGLCDLAITSFPTPLDTLRKDSLFEHECRVVMRSDHPAALDFSLEAWLEYPHLVVSANGVGRTGVDDYLALLGKERRIGLLVPNFSMVPELLGSTDLITTLPIFCLPNNDGNRFALFEPPFPLQKVVLHIAWDARNDGDPVIQHIVKVVKEATHGFIPQA